MNKKSGKAPFISDEDLAFFFSNLSGTHSSRNKAVILVSHFLGLRAKEIASLKIGDVYDQKRNTLKETVRLLAAYTKGGKFREVFLVNSIVIEALLEYLKTRLPCADDAPLFISQKGSFFSANTMQRMIGKCYKNAGINASSHSGRRSFATKLIENNADIYSIKQLMGHTSIATTQEYFSSNPNRLKEQLLKLKQ